MAKFQKFKSKKFEFQKDAMAWAKKEKTKMKGQSVKIETNHLTNQPTATQWEGIVLKNVSDK